MWHRSSTPQPHPAVLPHLQCFKTPDMAQSGGCPQEALGTSWDTAADCRLRLTQGTEDLAWPGTQKKKKVLPSTKTECDYLNGWIRKWSHAQKFHRNGEPLRYIAGKCSSSRRRYAAMTCWTFEAHVVPFLLPSPHLLHCMINIQKKWILYRWFLCLDVCELKSDLVWWYISIPVNDLDLYWRSQVMRTCAVFQLWSGMK